MAAAATGKAIPDAKNARREESDFIALLGTKAHCKIFLGQMSWGEGKL
jgi:hypothetical protein